MISLQLIDNLLKNVSRNNMDGHGWSLSRPSNYRHHMYLKLITAIEVRHFLGGRLRPIRLVLVHNHYTISFRPVLGLTSRITTFHATALIINCPNYTLSLNSQCLANDKRPHGHSHMVKRKPGPGVCKYGLSSAVYRVIIPSD